MGILSLSSGLGNELQNLLLYPDIQPGDMVSYQQCKTIYVYHPLGKKIVDGPIELAMSKPRSISVPDAPEDLVTEAFVRTWILLKCDQYIAQTERLKMMYGLATLTYDVDAIKTPEQVDDNGNVIKVSEKYTREDVVPPELLSDIDLIFQVFDPLNTSGSLVLNQNPSDSTFMKPVGISVSGKKIAPSRCCVVMNEDPIYIEYTTSAYGFVGRSVYQRALYPLKSFIQSMITDNLVQEKAGILVIAQKMAGSIVDNIVKSAQKLKANVLKDSQTGNIITIGHEDRVESLDLTNLGQAVEISRGNIIKNCAVASNIPYQLLGTDSFATGFGEGNQDYKSIADFIKAKQMAMQPLYDYMDKIVMRKAWSRSFYATVQKANPEEYGSMDYEAAFMKWQNSFVAEWPDLFEESVKNKIDYEKIKTDTVLSAVEKLGNNLDPQNKAVLLEWAADNLNDLKQMFPNKLIFDGDELIAFESQKAILENYNELEV